MFVLHAWSIPWCSWRKWWECKTWDSDWHTCGKYFSKDLQKQDYISEDNPCALPSLHDSLFFQVNFLLCINQFMVSTSFYKAGFPTLMLPPFYCPNYKEGCYLKNLGSSSKASISSGDYLPHGSHGSPNICLIA